MSISAGDAGYEDGLKRTKPSDKQVGGDHYKSMAIQPSEFNFRNKLNWLEGNAVKYICRHRQKHGRADIEKAIHYLELLLEWEYDNESDVTVRHSGSSNRSVDEARADTLNEWLGRFGLEYCSEPDRIRIRPGTIEYTDTRFGHFFKAQTPDQGRNRSGECGGSYPGSNT